MTPQKFLKGYEALLAKHGSQREVALAVGIPRSTIQFWLSKRDELLFVERKPEAPIFHAVPKRGVKRFILTSAQDESEVHAEFWKNLKAYSEYFDAPIMISGYTYAKGLNDKDGGLFAPEIEPYLTNRRHDIGHNLTWCAEMNTLPTATTPLSGFETYTKAKSGIFPHAKVQLVPVPVAKGAASKQIMTTGSVTKRNYLAKRAGLQASFHHIIGAVLVELDSDGDHFCRHLIAEEDTGNFQDLTRYVSNGKVSEGNRVLAITHGDLHTENIDPVIAKAVWGVEVSSDGTVQSRIVSSDSMMAVLQPEFQFLHDTSDFNVRNHHNNRDPIFRFRQWHVGDDCVATSYSRITSFLGLIAPAAERTVCVWSNHDAAGLRWVKEGDWKTDPANAQFYLDAAAAYLKATAKGEEFSMLAWAVKRESPTVAKAITWLGEDESYMLLDIENGMHGHNGANGSAGSLRQFTRAGAKSNTGHRHSPGILDGAFCAGTYSKLDMGYNRGLSSWAHACIFTYPNGSRTIVTLTPSGKFCAQDGK